MGYIWLYVQFQAGQYKIQEKKYMKWQMKEITFMNYLIYLQNYAKILKFVYNYYRALIYFGINLNKDIKGKCSSSQSFVMETSDHVNFLL